MHDGVCIDGRCRCVAGYSGEYCAEGGSLLESDWLRRVISVLLLLAVVVLLLVVLFILLKMCLDRLKR